MKPSYSHGSLSTTDALRLLPRVCFHPLDRPSDAANYQDAVARVLGVKHAFPLGAGRMALYLLLKALDLPAQAEVIVPGYTCVVVPNAVRFAGLRPVYADIRTSDYNVEPGAIRSLITSRTCAVVMQHTFGIPAEIHEIRSLCRAHGLFLIEDGAHALGAVYDGKHIGHWGDAAFFSSQEAKMICTGMGGILVVKDGELAEKISSIYSALPLRDSLVERLACVRTVYKIIVQEFLPPGARPLRRLMERAVERFVGAVTRSRSVQFPDIEEAEYEAEMDGAKAGLYPRRLNGILCRMASLQMERLHEDVAERNRKAEYLARELPSLGAQIPVYDPRRAKPSFVRFPCLVQSRESWLHRFRDIGIPPSIWFNAPLHPVTARCQQANGYTSGLCPNAEFVSRHIINFPVGRSVAGGVLELWLQKLRSYEHTSGASGQGAQSRNQVREEQLADKCGPVAVPY
jgi:perosamine synthetase